MSGQGLKTSSGLHPPALNSQSPRDELVLHPAPPPPHTSGLCSVPSSSCCLIFQTLLPPPNGISLAAPCSLSHPPLPAHLPGTELEETLAVLRDVPAPGLGPNGVEETRTATQLLSEQRPESGLGAEDLHTPNPGVDAALQEAQFSSPRLPGGTPASLELSRLLGHTRPADQGGPLI